MEDLEHVLELVSAMNAITFTKDELLCVHIKLHIAIEWRGMILVRVFIDNDFSFKCLLYHDASKNWDQETFNPSKCIMVHAFDGTNIASLLKNWSEGSEPCEFVILFVVVDILVVFNLLLVRSLTHTADAVPSSLIKK